MPPSQPDGLAFRWLKALDNPPTTDPLTCLTAATMYRFASPNGSNVYPTLAQMSRRTGLSERTLSGRRKRLVGLGMVALVTPARTNHAPVYRLVDPQLWQSTEAATPDVVADVVEVVEVTEVQSPTPTLEDWVDPYAPEFQPTDPQPGREPGRVWATERARERLNRPGRADV